MTPPPFFWKTLSFRLRVLAGRIALITGRKRAENEIRQRNKELEQRLEEQTLELQQRTRDLEAATSELESFTYSMAHDLRAPLRNISGFLALYQRDAVPDDKARYLNVIQEEAKRMSGLIDDLATLARLGRTELRKRMICVEELVSEVRQGLTTELQNRKVVWQVDPLPRVLADRHLLHQALVSLLGNAVKYTRKKEEARIHIGCRSDAPKELTFWIRDNGAGFNMRYAKRLFGVFQRLHSPKEFEGAGLGLAKVRRILQRHGGRVWAESEEGQGATFFFSLPDPG